MNPTSETDSTETIEEPVSTEFSPRQKQRLGEFLHLGRFNIGTRLGLCFLVIIALMLAGSGLLLWQFNLVHIQGNRLNAIGKELIAVSRFQTDFFRLNARLDELAKSEDIDGLKKEAEPLRTVLLSDTGQTRDVISRLPADLQDPTLVTTLEAIQSTLPSQLDKITALAEASDWEAVRQRLANEKKPLEADVAALVRTVEQQVSKELSAELLGSARMQNRILVIVPVTAVFTLAVAAFLGLFVTRSITRPLRSLVAGSRAWAKGDFSYRIKAEGNDELAKLGTVFNDTAGRLSSLYDTLQRKEAYLSEAQRLAHCGSWAWNVRSGELFWSEEMFRILAFDSATTQASWALFLDRVHPQDRPLVEQRAAKETSDNEAADPGADYRIVLPDGRLKYLYSVAHRVLGNSGQVLEVVGTTMDVTASKQAEAALLSAERNLRLIINTIPTTAWSTRPDGYCDFLNERWLRYAGMTAEQAEGWGWGAGIHPGDLKELVAYWQSCLASGTPVEAEARMRRFDGVYRWFLFRANPLRDESGKIIKWFGTNIDIDDRKRAEDQVRRGEAFLAEGQRLSSTGSYSWKVASNEITWSAQLYRIYEFDLGVPITPELIRSRVHPDDRTLFEVMAELAREGKNDFEWQYRLLMPDHSIKYLHAVGHATRDPDGQVEYIAVVQDVTARRLSEEALAKARSDLARVARNTSLEVLTASIAHEVNQPLSGIITNASTCLRMLSANPPNIEGARETARRTIRDGNRASGVITRLRTLL
jgi:PAS domain S-box-containing protein